MAQLMYMFATWKLFIVSKTPIGFVFKLFGNIHEKTALQQPLQISAFFKMQA